MPIINNPKTQSTVDNILNTLQIWFGSGDNTNQNPNNQFPNQNPDAQVCPTGQRLVNGVCVPRNTGGSVNTGGKNNTLKYIGIGAGVIVIGLTAFLIIKKRKK